MRIIFTRHGESEANVLHEISNRGLKHGLTRKGRAQALELADKLRHKQVHRIYCSPILRAIETTVIIANALGLDYEVAGGLREYDCGQAEGRSDEAAWQMWQALYDDWDVHKRYDRRIEGGESFHDIARRFVPLIDGLVARYGGTDNSVLCVAHGGLYALMLPLVLRNVDRELIARHGLGHTVSIVAEQGPRGLLCTAWNDAAISSEWRSPAVDG
jgi:probable phosphoglycerate mutase